MPRVLVPGHYRWLPKQRVHSGVGVQSQRSQSHLGLFPHPVPPARPHFQQLPRDFQMLGKPETARSCTGAANARTSRSLRASALAAGTADDAAMRNRDTVPRPWPARTGRGSSARIARPSVSSSNRWNPSFPRIVAPLVTDKPHASQELCLTPCFERPKYSFRSPCSPDRK
jgi:hypothetical protein